jgi:hypothetical protein
MFVFFFFLTPLAMAADGSVSGTVRDPSYSVVYNVPIVITNANTGKKIQTRTGRAGDFGPISLSIGEYKVQITALCFKPYSKVIEIADGQVLHLDIRVGRIANEGLPNGVGKQVTSLHRLISERN